MIMKERLRKIIISAVIFIIAIMIEKFKFLNLDSNAIFIIQVVLYVLSYFLIIINPYPVSILYLY